MQDCLFCKIAAGEIPAKLLYQDEDCIAFYDIEPQAPLHFLVVPKRHIQSADSLKETDALLLAKMFKVIQEICKEQGIDEGYRIVTNIGREGGQSVAHLHFHVLAGRKMCWPPG